MLPATKPRFILLHHERRHIDDWSNHKFFRDTERAKGEPDLVIADHSGSTPDRTDDGPLYVNTAEDTIRLEPHGNYRSHWLASIVVTTRTGTKSCVPLSEGDVRYLVKQHKARLRVAGVEYAPHDRTPA